jgi:hypothetical protein
MERLRIKPQRTHCEEMDTLVSELSGSPPSGCLTVVVIYSLCRKRPDRKCVCDDLDRSSGRAVLACGGGQTGCGLHGIGI